MYLLNEEPAELRDLLDEEKQIAEALFEQIPVADSALTIQSESSVFENKETANSILRIKEGVVRSLYGERVQYILEEGDLFGFERHFVPNSKATYQTDFAVIVSRYDIGILLSTVQKSAELHRLWSKFLVVRAGILRVLGASFQREEVHFNPELVSFSEGDVLIEQGSVGDRVFTMAEGSADVFVDGVKVGEVLKDEMFGAIATLTDTPRTASVVATSSCLVLALPKDKFVDLTKNRPGTVQQLVENMARTIVDLNEQVVKLRLSE